MKCGVQFWTVFRGFSAGIFVSWRWSMPYSVAPPFSSAVVLCIDDNQDVLECERAFLEIFGYTVLTASSSGKGLELASTQSVDVVLLTYLMPTMNGQALA